MAKLIIRLINAVADVVNRDPNVNQHLKVYFLPNYGISLAERIIPAADISEQISTAGTEASGTGNMKLSLNGALTVGTLDGANVEIREVVGPENFFLFGMNHDQIVEQREKGYDPRAQAEANIELREVLQSIDHGDFSPNDRGLFRPIVDALLHHGDPYFVIADFPSYREVHKTVTQTYRDTAEWTRKSIVNVANMGRFSSDLTISRYAKEIWNAKSVKET
jgi:starch phosphorylase